MRQPARSWRRRWASVRVASDVAERGDGAGFGCPDRGSFQVSRWSVPESRRRPGGERRAHRRHLGLQRRIQPGVASEIVGPASGDAAAALLAKCTAQALDETVMLLRCHGLELAGPHGHEPWQIACAVVGGQGARPRQGARARSRLVGRAFSGHASFRSVVTPYGLTAAGTGDKSVPEGGRCLVGNDATRHVGPTGLPGAVGKTCRGRGFGS